MTEDTPAVLSQVKLCEDHGYSHEWASGQEPKIAEKSNATRRTLYRSLSQYYQHVLPSRAQVLLLHRYCRTCLMILHRVQQHDVTVQAFQYWDDSCEILQKPKNTNKQRDIVLAPGNRLQDLPECFEEFTENIEDEGVLTSRDTTANTSRDSDSVRLTKVVSRKHIIFTHCPKDQNCEECKRTMVTRAL